MKKNFKKFIAVLLLIPCLFIFSSCFGDTGKSAYEIAIENGYKGTEVEWLASLKGSVESSAYEAAVKNGFKGTELEWLASLKGEGGKSAYEIAVENGYKGTELEWLESIKGENGSNGQLELSDAISRNLLSVVSIFASFPNGVAGGAGVIIKDDKITGTAYIITNYHVVFAESPIGKISTDIKVFLYGQEYPDRAISVRYVGGSMTYDIAVLKIENSDIYKTSNAVVAEIDRSQVCGGEHVFAIGNPAGLGIAATKGIVSVESQEIELMLADGKTEGKVRVIRTDAGVNGGNSGGGLFNQEGKLVGIVNAKMIDTDKENIENIGYAIPINVAYGVASNIMAQETAANIGTIKVQSCQLGVMIRMTDSVSRYDEKSKRTIITQTLVIDSVVADGAAEGHLKSGDILQSFIFEGKTIASDRLFTVSDFLLYFNANETFHMTVLRKGETVTVNIPLKAAQTIA